jgi:hypothetical protein
MLLNTTIHALIASTTATTAHVIAGLLVRSASPAVFAVVPKRKRVCRSMRWRSPSGQPDSDCQQCCGEYSEHCQKSLSRSHSLNGRTPVNQGSGCLNGTGGRS